MAFNPKDLGAYKEFLDTQSKISKVMSRSSKDYASGIKDAVVAKRDLIKAQKQLAKLEKEELELEKKKLKLSGEELALAEKRLAAIRAEKKEVQKIVEQQKALSKAISSQVKSVKNLTLAVGKDLLKGLGKVVVKAKELGKEFSANDDAMRRTAVNVGLVGKQFHTLRKNAYKAALVTQRIGVDAKDLVESYGSYVDEVGRLIPLTAQAGKALAFMSKGTALGAQGAAQMAASMEVMGMSMEGTASYVEDVSNMTSKLGINSGKTLKLLATNMRKAQTVRFKGGVDGMAKMAAKAISLRADMAATLGLAQDLWEPEKAIETAASLQMMGGAFAKMADPLKLMFDARNNPGKLMEDLANAASASVKLKDGVYEISSMELTRLREVAKTTNQDFEQIVEMAKTAAKRNDIGKFLNPKIGGDQREFIKNIATMGEDGKFTVTVDGKAKKVSELTQEQVKNMMAADKSLAKRSEDAMGFMSRLQAMWKSLQNLGMQFFAGMDESLGPLLDSLTGRGEGSLASLGDKMFELGKNFGEWINVSAKPFIEKAIPMIGALTGKLTSAVGSTAEFFKSTVIPATQAVYGHMKAWWDRNGGFIKEVLKAAGKLSKAVWKFMKFLGPKGALAMILLVKFPGILRGVMSGLKGILGMAGGGRRGSPTNPMYVVGMGGSGGGGGGQGGMIDQYGRGGRYGGRNSNRSGGRGGLKRILTGFRKGGIKGGFKSMGRMFAGRGVSRMAMGGAGMKMNMGKTVGGRGGASMLGGLGAKLGKGMAVGGPLALIGLGAEMGRMFMDDPDTTMGKTLGVLGTTASDAAVGAMIGSVIPGLGTAIGGLIGGIVGFGRSMYREITTKGKGDFDMSGAKGDIGSNKLAMANTSYLADGVVKFHPQDKFLSVNDSTMIAGTNKGGNRELARAMTGGASNVNVNISGTINLAGGGTSVSMDGLLKDPVFKAEVTKVVIAGMKENT